MTKSKKRLSMLEEMVSKGSDAFALYALALEYRKEERPLDALATFERLRREHSDYLPMYLMAGQMLIELDREDEARPWLEQGVKLARQQGNPKALAELESALAAC